MKKRNLTADTSGAELIGHQAATVSPYGVVDLIGSVSEWVKDWYAEDFYQTSSVRDPQGPSRGSFRVLRGGEWNEKSPNLQASYRGWDDVTYWGRPLVFVAQKTCPDPSPHDSCRFCCKRGYAATTGSLAIQPFDILREYASGLHGSECPSRVASARFRNEPS